MHGDRAKAEHWSGFHKWGLIDVVGELGDFYRRFALGPYLLLQDADVT